MTMQRLTRLSLAGAIALALSGTAAAALAQSAPQQAAAQQMPPPPAPPPQGTAPPAAPGQFYQGTESSATYALPDSHGGTLTVHAGMPNQEVHYGPPPAFNSLDTNHDGRLSETEAQAYPPLDSDFLYASGGGTSISRAQYKKWVATQH